MCLLVNNFCCCISLDLGTKLISLISTALCAQLTSFNYIIAYHETMLKGHRLILKELTSSAILVLYGTPVVLLPSLPPSRLVFYASMAVAALLQFVFACILGYAAFKKKAKFMLPWQILVWGKCVTLMVLTIAGMILLMWYSDSPTASQTSTIISVYFVYAVTLFYFVSVVESRRQELQREDYSESAKRLMRPVVIPNHYVV